MAQLSMVEAASAMSCSARANTQQHLIINSTRITHNPRCARLLNGAALDDRGRLCGELLGPRRLGGRIPPQRRHLTLVSFGGLLHGRQRSFRLLRLRHTQRMM